MIETLVLVTMNYMERQEDTVLEAQVSRLGVIS